MSTELERVILGAVLMEPAAFLEDSDICAADFTEGRFRTVFQAITRLWEDQRIVDPVIISEKIGGENSGGAFIGELMNGALRLDLITFKARLLELRRRRISAEIVRASLQLSEGHLKTGDFDYSEFGRLRDLITKQSSLQLMAESDQVISQLKKGADLLALDYHVDSVIRGLLPERSITLFHGRGGSGKTWLSLQLARAVAHGGSFLSLETKAAPVVYVDFENPLPLLIDRIRRLDIKEVLFWHIAFDLKPPRLDADDWGLYRNLPARSVLIFDSLRAAQNLDENSSRDMAFILGRLKELREAGFTILLLHHTAKADERVYKGSTAILDLADHVIGLHRVRRDTFEEIDEFDLGPDACYRLGTREKTRYEPFRIFLNFSPEVGFTVADDPDESDLQSLAEIVRKGRFCQNEIFRIAREEFDIRRKERVRILLNKGDGRLWFSRKDGKKVVYESI